MAYRCVRLAAAGANVAGRLAGLGCGRVQTRRPMTRTAPVYIRSRHVRGACPVMRLIVQMNAVAATHRRKTAKSKVKLYEQRRLPHDEQPALAKKFPRRKMRTLKKPE